MPGLANGMGAARHCPFMRGWQACSFAKALRTLNCCGLAAGVPVGPAPALAFYGGSSLPFARPQNPPNASLAAPMPFASPGIGAFYAWLASLPLCQPA